MTLTSWIGRIVTNTASFKKLTSWAFSICDGDNDGSIGKPELYAGILLVHLELAKYAGCAACFPPTRDVCDHLFDACDDDESGFLDEQEFTKIVVICASQIGARVAVYYSFIIVMVPYLAKYVIQGILAFYGIVHLKGSRLMDIVFDVVDDILTRGKVAEKVVSSLMFLFVVPMLFNFIDRRSTTRTHQSMT
jgi:hypothetical protein